MQEEFDEAVKTNIEDFDMEVISRLAPEQCRLRMLEQVLNMFESCGVALQADEAVASAIEEFKLQVCTPLCRLCAALSGKGHLQSVESATYFSTLIG